MRKNSVVAREDKDIDPAAVRRPVFTLASQSVRLEVFGEEILEKSVRVASNSGRIYLPRGWVGHRVKIIRLD
jgi:hypothetical protein